MSIARVDESVNIQINSIQFGGVSFPSDSTLQVKYVNGKKEGEGLVISSKKTKLAKLYFHEDKLNGLCVFFDADGHRLSESVFQDGKVSEVYKLKNGERNGKYVLNGKVMKEYDGEKEVYEGEFEGSIDKGYIRNGAGICYLNENDFYSAVFERGDEKRKTRKCKGVEMIEYDERERVVYKGGFEKKGMSFDRKGKGLLFGYGEVLKEVYECENGMRTVKRMEFKSDELIELNGNGGIVYRGKYEGNPVDGFVRNGEGDEYDMNDTLVYSGEWKKGHKEGDGKYYRNGDLVFEGKWKDDKPNGHGKYYNSEGIMVKEGEWKNGYLHLKGSKWFSFVNGKEEKVIPMKKNKIPKYLKGRGSIEEMKDAKTSKKRICLMNGLFILVSLLVLLLIVFIVYYLYCVLRVNVVVHNSFEMRHIGKNARTIVVNDGVGQNMESVVISSIMIYD